MTAAAADRLEYIGLTEAALRFGLSRDTLARAARDGNLQTRRTGKLWLTTPAAVDAYLKGARHRPGRTPQRRLVGGASPPPTSSPRATTSPATV
jgi:excisionase family DNA binding protein